MTFAPFSNGSSVPDSPRGEKVARVIITGGTGFIGRPLSLLLIKEGFDVVCLTRNASAADNRGGSGIKFVEWDGKSAAGWSEYADGASVHGGVSWPISLIVAVVVVDKEHVLSTAGRIAAHVVQGAGRQGM